MPAKDTFGRKGFNHRDTKNTEKKRHDAATRRPCVASAQGLPGLLASVPSVPLWCFFWDDMSVKQIKLSSQAKDQPIRLKTRTGITQWNILCRWAFCLSLRQATAPTPVDIPADSNVEMSWEVFGGEWHELYRALLTERCIADGFDPCEETLGKQFRLHLHR